VRFWIEDPTGLTRNLPIKGKKKKDVKLLTCFLIEHNNPPSFYHPIGWRNNYDGADKSNKGCLHQKNNSHVCPTQV